MAKQSETVPMFEEDAPDKGTHFGLLLSTGVRVTVRKLEMVTRIIELLVPNTPLKEDVYGHGGLFLAERAKMPGARKIGAIVSGSSIAGGGTADISFFFFLSLSIVQNCCLGSSGRRCLPHPPAFNRPFPVLPSLPTGSPSASCLLQRSGALLARQTTGICLKGNNSSKDVKKFWICLCQN